MKIKLGEINEIIRGLMEITAKEIPVKPAYWFGKLIKQVKKESIEFEEIRAKLIKKYALTDENHKPIIEDDRYKLSDQEAFEREFSELLETETEINFAPISLEQLGDIKVSPNTMAGLEKFINE